MTPIIIIVFCSLLLIAYIFNLTSQFTKLPSVILLLIFGWGLKQVSVGLHIKVPDFNSLLPIIATIGLVLIVLEGALELELNKSKIGVIKKSLLGSLLPMFALAFLLAYVFHWSLNIPLKICLINAIPFCIISSAIAVPSVENLSNTNREFVIYESSFSDIFGVLFFNFVVMNKSVNLNSFGFFGLELIIMLVVSMVATAGLSFLLSRLNHHVKFVPIILLVILIFTVAELYHLPALIFILIFGLAIGNLDELREVKLIKRFNTTGLQKEITKFKDLTAEGAFLIRALFFILFGFLLDTSEIINPNTLIWSIPIVGLIILFRLIQLKISNLPISPLLFVSPRGLITILLFIGIAPENSLVIVNKSLVIQVIILTALFMTFGLMFSGKEKDQRIKTAKDVEEKKPLEISKETFPIQEDTEEKSV